jgi:hypothetical protein
MRFTSRNLRCWCFVFKLRIQRIQIPNRLEQNNSRIVWIRRIQIRRNKALWNQKLGESIATVTRVCRIKPKRKNNKICSSGNKIQHDEQLNRRCDWEQTSLIDGDGAFKRESRKSDPWSSFLFFVLLRCRSGKLELIWDNGEADRRSVAENWLLLLELNREARVGKVKVREVEKREWWIMGITRREVCVCVVWSSEIITRPAN